MLSTCLRSEAINIKAEQARLGNQLEDDNLTAKHVHMAKVFEHINELNTKTQRKSESIVPFSDKLRGFQQKLLHWCSV